MEGPVQENITSIKVFDFDGTLIDFDSTEVFFIKIAKEKRQLWVPAFILILKVISKVGLISVKRAKEMVLNILFDSSDEFESKTASFGKGLELNNVGKDIVPGDKNIYILSATLEPILKAAMPGSFVIGSTVLFENNRFTITSHPFREEKANILNGLIGDKDFTFYTDSTNDLPCSMLASKTVWVKNGKIKRTTTR